MESNLPWCRTTAKASENAEHANADDGDARRTVSTTGRSPNTNANDWCRLAHVAGDPALHATFTAAFQPLSREKLDAPREDRQNPWWVVFDAYNDAPNPTVR
jgi:hypothetical protein